MEPFRFAIELIGLTGLSNICLEFVDKLGLWKDVGSESRSLAAQLETHKVRLQRCGSILLPVLVHAHSSERNMRVCYKIQARSKNQKSSTVVRLAQTGPLDE